MALADEVTALNQTMDSISQEMWQTFQPANAQAQNPPMTWTMNQVQNVQNAAAAAQIALNAISDPIAQLKPLLNQAVIALNNLLAAIPTT